MTTNHIELIKEKLSILDVVGSYVKLEQAGKDWKGKSPFTNEKTPSFYVSPDKGFYYCFSSGKGGDMFSFIQEMERIEFKEALILLAERAGVDLGKSDYQEDSPDKVLYQLLDDATKWYEVNLRKNKEVVDYLVGRGLTKETIVAFRIGYAKDSWDDLYTYLKKKKYTDQQIQQAGMGVARGQGSYDRFRSRIMFPFRDHRGRVVAFSGRIFTKDLESKEAKYVNSPEGPLFDKSKILFGYDSAKQAIAKQETCILVEGQFDVIMSQQAGNLNTVAVSGTGLTDEHIKIIHRFAKTIILGFDADSAGIKATKRSVLKAYEHGLSVKAVILPPGKDPADIIKETPSQWQVALSSARDYLGYRLDIFNREFPQSSFEERHQLITQEIFSFVQVVSSKVVQEKYLQDIALFLGVHVDSVQKDFESFMQHNVVETESSNQEVLAVEPKIKSSSDISHEEIVGLSLLIKEQDEVSWKTVQEKYDETFLEITGSRLNQYVESFQDTILAMLSFKYQSMFESSNVSKLIELLHTNIVSLQIRKLKQDSEELLSSIRRYEHQGDEAHVAQLQHEHLELRKKIDELSLTISM
jgi:DNA primase